MNEGVEASEATQFRVDLKWSLWSGDVSHWQEYAGEAYGGVKAALQAGVAVEVVTAPRKEIRSGVVRLWREGKQYWAEVAFHAEWDDPEDLVLDLGLPEDVDVNRIDILVPRNDHGDPGCSRTETVEAGSFAELLKRIDAVEEALLEDEKAEWEAFEALMTA